MKLHVLAVLLFCMMGRFSSAQADSLQRYLIPPIDTTLTTFPYTTVLPFDELPYWPDVPPYYPPRYEDWWDELTLGTYALVFVLPTCGDTYHANGQLASRISCKDSVFDGLTTYWNEKGVKTSETNYVNGKPEGKAYSWSANGVKTSERTYVNGKEHGKTIHWDDNGHKQYEYTYAYGRYFKAKTYGLRGQLESVDHYTYTKAGNQVLHGLSINYGDNAKEINRYKNGKMDGISQWFKHGKLIREQRYKADYLLEQKTWSPSQHLIGHNTYNSTGQIEHLQSWDTSGVLLKEEFHHNSRCIGIWTSYYPPTESKTLTYFTDLNEPAQLL
jgi:antitoxin component YwqK of YwqJK toxin-antitoxin module